MRERRRRSHTQVLLALCWFFKVNYKVLLLSHNLVRSACFSPLIKDGLEVTDQRGRFKQQEENQDGKTEQGKKTLLYTQMCSWGKLIISYIFPQIGGGSGKDRRVFYDSAGAAGSETHICPTRYPSHLAQSILSHRPSVSFALTQKLIQTEQASSKPSP